MATTTKEYEIPRELINDHRYIKDHFGRKLVKEILELLWQEQHMIQRAGDGTNQHSPYVWWRPSKFQA